MLLRKISKGLYAVIDDHNNNYRVEDSHRPEPEYNIPDSLEPEERWCIFEQEKGEWVFLDANETLKDSLGVIETWAAASELGT